MQVSREIREKIFVDTGEYSYRACQLVHDRLAEGITSLGRLQQLSCLPTTEPTPHLSAFKKCREEIIDVVADIATALGCNAALRSVDNEAQIVLEIITKQG
jgi:hypothetical protein